ncbi:LRR domain containing protein [Trema orientale]|uniref:LRR domain containing protein n=1 Tax=Trema orientale TaxID=63057 RepID=A0A2P5F944_TREOI|nr:LRR domain containing protein [Trema orientale]
MRIPLLSWLFLIPICLILLGVEIDVVYGQCLSHQQSLLLQLKNDPAFNATESKKLKQWNQSSDCCLWDGVTCDDKGRVTGLSLSNESISGDIDNSSLFNLQHLESLDLSYNNFNSTIPARIGNLTALSYLNLSNAGFGGQIPKEISQLTRLVILDLSTLSFLQISSLKLEDPNLRMLAQNLSQLEELYLDSVNISAAGGEWCQALSSSVTKLQVLSLTNCFLSGPIDQSLENLRSLSVIRLDNNNLNASVPEFFSSFTNLTSLRLSSCGLEGVFPKKIFQVRTLKVIDISNNQLLKGSLPEFQRNNALQRVVLRQTNVSGELPTSIGNLLNLSRLELAYCQFTGRLPNSMEKLTQLAFLDLSVNNFTGPIPSFNMSKNLTELVLSYNGLTGEILSVHWEGLLKLLVLDLRNNLLSGSIPPSLFALPSLQKIQLSFNQFSGQVLEFQTPSSSILETLDLSGNNLEGPLPNSFFELRKLKILSLSSNKFNGTMQFDVIQRLSNLTTLDLSYNSLSVNAWDSSSSLPSFPNISTLKLASCKLTTFPNLKNQSKLVFLDLSDNQIYGEIPNWIWELGNGLLFHLNLSHNHLISLQEPYVLSSSLFVLDLHFNQLHGKIPVLPPVCTYIDFSGNNFSSSIPADIGNYLNITIFFSVSNNKLTGVIPDSICNAIYLQVLDLSDNSLSSKIPECIPAMSQTLGVLNLRRNNFRGLIPNTFPVNCTLETLDFNGNSIEGEIPNSLASCTRLEVLDLGNNMLTGNFSCFLKNISTLRVLVLRSNRFQGRIGCLNNSGNWEMLQIVDLAHNNFSGDLLGNCLKRWQAMMVDNAHKLKHLSFEFLELSQSRYYQDAVTVTFKGLEIKLQKILTLFTSIDLSGNHLIGPIPEEVGLLRALYVLNLSSNALTGGIPSSIGNLSQLESLDLSSNNLNGSIPESLASLTFLSFLNLSFNQLVGLIPYGTQIQTFSPDSFAGNKALCGVPLSVNCNATDSEAKILPEFSGLKFAWQSIYTGIGFGVGGGALFALLMFWEEGRNWLEDSIDKILLVVLPMMGYTYKPRHEWDDEDEEDTEDEDSDFFEDHELDEMEDEYLQGRYCVFCSKLDISRKKVIHDPRCTCQSPFVSSSSFSSSSSSGST